MSNFQNLGKEERAILDKLEELSRGQTPPQPDEPKTENEKKTNFSEDAEVLTKEDLKELEDASRSTENVLVTMKDILEELLSSTQQINESVQAIRTAVEG